MSSSERRALIGLFSPERLHRLDAQRSRQPLEHQWRPEGQDWTTWLMLGGRGSGKTFAGSFWIADLAADRPQSFALVGPTLHDVREVMIEGPSGLKAVTPSGERPRWEASRRRLVWKNGSVAQAFSAEDPDSLRGPQFHHAWADEFCAWRRPERVLEMLRLGLRLGEAPRLALTTTPRPIPALRRLMAEPGLVLSRAATGDNAAHLSPRFLSGLQALYGGTRLAAQELDGLVVEGEGALFRAEDLARARGSRPVEMDRVVVAVDPPASHRGDACGIVAVGRWEGRAFVLADRTQGGLSPAGWAARVADLALEVGAAAIVAEINQGGDMVRTLLAQTGCGVKVKPVWAGKAKRARAEPVAALYEQGRVVHCGDFPALEEELMALGSEADGERRKSPDRADALVWAVSELLLQDRGAGPRITVL